MNKDTIIGIFAISLIATMFYFANRKKEEKK